MLQLFFLFISTLVMIFFIAVLTRAFNQWKNPISIGLYVKGLRAENDGHFEEAITAYETALAQCKKLRFQQVFKNKIIGKVKLLHTLVDYDNSARYIR
ncbi:MAG TPA: hypothetical protein VKU83_04145 [Puia sp.]|nr:hypothetical protein [Puia sp.]